MSWQHSNNLQGMVDKYTTCFSKLKRIFLYKSSSARERGISGKKGKPRWRRHIGVENGKNIVRETSEWCHHVPRYHYNAIYMMRMQSKAGTCAITITLLLQLNADYKGMSLLFFSRIKSPGMRKFSLSFVVSKRLNKNWDEREGSGTEVGFILKKLAGTAPENYLQQREKRRGGGG